MMIYEVPKVFSNFKVGSRIHTFVHLLRTTTFSLPFAAATASPLPLAIHSHS